MLSALSASLPSSQGEAGRATPRSTVNGQCGVQPNVPSSRKASQNIISATPPIPPLADREGERAVPNEPSPSFGEGEARVGQVGYLVDPASSHMLVSKIKPCMSKYKQFIP